MAEPRQHTWLRKCRHGLTVAAENYDPDDPADGIRAMGMVGGKMDTEGGTIYWSDSPVSVQSCSICGGVRVEYTEDFKVIIEEPVKMSDILKGWNEPVNPPVIHRTQADMPRPDEVERYLDDAIFEAEPEPDAGFPSNDDDLSPRDIAEKAIHLVYGARNADYGHPADDYGRTAALWSAFLGTEITPAQAAMCMVLVKISREANKPKPDNRVDAHGYLIVYDRILNRERGRE